MAVVVRVTRNRWCKRQTKLTSNGNQIGKLVPRRISWRNSISVGSKRVPYRQTFQVTAASCDDGVMKVLHITKCCTESSNGITDISNDRHAAMQLQGGSAFSWTAGTYVCVYVCTYVQAHAQNTVCVTGSADGKNQGLLPSSRASH